MHSLKENDLHADGSVKDGWCVHSFMAVSHCVCTHRLHSGRTHKLCELKSPNFWLKLMNKLGKPHTVLPHHKGCCATYFINQWLILWPVQNKGSITMCAVCMQVEIIKFCDELQISLHISVSALSVCCYAIGGPNGRSPPLVGGN